MDTRITRAIGRHIMCRRTMILMIDSKEARTDVKTEFDHFFGYAYGWDVSMDEHHPTACK